MITVHWSVLLFAFTVTLAIQAWHFYRKGYAAGRDASTGNAWIEGHKDGFLRGREVRDRWSST